MAHIWAKNSKCVRKKVGALIVKDNRIISDGYNGTPHGFDNECEYESRGIKRTKQQVLHAESNAITKIAKSTLSCEGSTLYVTMQPCFDCAKLIIQSGIEKVIYDEVYRDTLGVILLQQANIEIIQLCKLTD